MKSRTCENRRLGRPKVVKVSKDQADFTKQIPLTFFWNLFTKGNMCWQTWELIYKKD